MSGIVAALILLACLGLSFLPLVLEADGEEAPREEGPSHEVLLLERRRLLAEIREIDMDLTMGKMSETDHANLRAGLERDAIAVLDMLGELEAGGEEE